MSDEQDTTAPLEVATLQQGWATKTAARPRCYAYVTVGAKTDLGQVRENNEDKFDLMEPDEPSVLATKGRVFAVADGMGGHSAGQIASELSLNVFIRSYYSNTSAAVEDNLTRAVREANAYVVDVARAVPGRSGMGATLTAAIIRDDEIFLCQVGDSRCYLLRDGQLQQLTEDHSWVAEQVRAGVMSEKDAEQSPFRNVITRSMGGAPEVEPDLSAGTLLPGDRYLLCSDGLSGMVAAEELAGLLAQGSPSVAAWSLVERANQMGGKDNITAMVLQIGEIVPWPEEDGQAEPLSEPASAASEAASANGHAPELSAPGPAGDDGAADSGKARAGLMGRLFGR